MNVGIKYYYKSHVIRMLGILNSLYLNHPKMAMKLKQNS